MVAHPPITLIRHEVPTAASVFVFDLTSQAAKLELARQALIELQGQHPQSPESNVKARYMSPWKSHTLTPKLGPLCRDVVTLTKTITREHMGYCYDSLKWDLKVTDCWGAIYEGGDHTIRHNHSPADWGVSIYLSADELSSPIIFAGKYAIQPKPGMMVLFPGWLDHEVPHTESNRTIIAMNLCKFPAIDMQVPQST